MSQPTVSHLQAHIDLIDSMIDNGNERSAKLRADRDSLVAQLLSTRKAAAKPLPVDDFELGAILAFDKTYGGNKVYSFAAIKALNGRWFVTGKQPIHYGGMIWLDLLQFIGQREPQMPDIYYLTAWKRMEF